MKIFYEADLPRENYQNIPFYSDVVLPNKKAISSVLLLFFAVFVVRIVQGVKARQ
jgi:hypothetical protein